MIADVFVNLPVKSISKAYTYRVPAELSFLGVASCLDLYLNGEFIGYSEGAHNTAEFDITPHIREGANENWRACP